MQDKTERLIQDELEHIKSIRRKRLIVARVGIAIAILVAIIEFVSCQLLVK